MKLCLTAKGNTMDSELDPRFGRCKYFLFIDSETKEHEFIENPNTEAMGGVGIQAGKLMDEKNVKFVISGNIGPNAFDTLKAAEINVVTNASGTLEDVLEKYKKGEYSLTSGATVNKKAGM